MRRAVVCALAFATALAQTALGATRDAAQEADIDGAVGAVDPVLVSVLHEGNAAMDRGDAAEAARDYEIVHTRAPKVPAVTRRLGVAEARSGHVHQGVAHCRQAVAADPSAENHAALAAAIMLTGTVLGDDLDEAFAEAKAAVKLAPNTEYAQATLCQAAFAAGDLRLLETCTAKLRKLAPDSAETHLFTAVAMSSHDDYDGAERELAIARKDGLSEVGYKRLVDEVEKNRPRAHPVQQTVTWTLVGFVGTLFVLFVLGMLLSDTASSRAASGKTLGRAMRVLYRVVLTVAGLFFYVFTAIVSAVFAVCTAGVVVVFFQMTHPSLVVRIVASVVTLYVLFVVVRASFARVSTQDEGARVDLAKEKRLRTALDRVAKKLGERTIDEVRVRSDASIEVVERGGIIGHMRGASPRVLHIGAFALEGLSQNAFEALVASEMARFRDGDGAGGGVALAEREALDALCDRMHARGVATASNPVWWIVASFRMFFTRIAEGAIDLQEVLADERAAEVHGSGALIEGLRHLVRRRIDFEGRASEMVRDAIAPTPDAEPTPRDDRQAFDDAWREYADREKRIAKLDTDDDEDESPAWALLSDREALERAMTAELRAAVDLEIGITREAPSP